MSKHPLSPAPLPPHKRVHTAHEEHLGELQPSFDAVLSDEIILFVFSYLAPADLCAVQRTNRNWFRLSLDNQLWKSLYISEFGRTRLRGARGFIGRTDGREIKPLPGRAWSEDIKDWKWMFRISSNWRTGRCSLEHLDLVNSPRQMSNQRLFHPTHLLLSGNLTLMASSIPSTMPTILLSSPAHDPYRVPCLSSHSTHPCHITALALDQSPPSSGHQGRLICFLSTGQFTSFTIDHQAPASSTRTFTYQQGARISDRSPIIQAAYHHPLLITLSQSFRVSLYDLSSHAVRHTQTLNSYTSYPPTSLVLSSQSPSSYKLVIAYAIPVYPSHWSVGATELIISNAVGSSMTVSSSRTARAIDTPQGFIDEVKMRAVQDQWSRKVIRVADTQTDGKWVVLAPGPSVPREVPRPSRSGGRHTSIAASSSASSISSSSTHFSSSTYSSSSLHTASGLQLYRVSFPSSTTSLSSPKLTYVRTLHGQIGPVSNLALADGRCVSLGVNNSIWVWDLEAGTGTEVSPGISGPDDDSEGYEAAALRLRAGLRGAVVFDDRRIVSSHGAEVEIRRFDV
ncbi:hypothetical protein BD413DRAFT_561338 [Trametes elegans]|nr:hypothetical protein BD413DRAFT_561338 [Trametes elegans]